MEPAGLETFDVIVRIVVAAGLGMLIGLERERRQRAAGIRTHALVASGAALFTLAGAYGFAEIPRSENVDPMRVAAQVASGIGFIGAGAIIRHGASVSGVTTAAALWASAAVGVASGAGFFQGAIVGFGAVLVALVLLRVVRDAAPRMVAGDEAVELEVVYERGRGTIAEVLDAVRANGSTIVDLTVDDDGAPTEVGLRRARVRARTDDRPGLEASVEGLTGLPEVRSVELRSAVARPATEGADASPGQESFKSDVPVRP